MKTILLTLLLTLPTFAQLDYGPRAQNKEAAVKMHFAIKLFRGVDEKQEAFLLKAIANRRAVSEAEAKEIFTQEEVRDVFFGIGREDVTDFKRIYEREWIAEKKAVWETLVRDAQYDVRRVTLAWGVGYLKFNEAQIDYALRFSKALPSIRKEDLPTWEAEAVALFPKEIGWLVFGSVGPYKDKPCEFVKVRSLSGNCPCSIGSSFNMQCNNECSAPGNSCTVTEDGCGFGWLYACSGNCQTQPQNDLVDN
jgi:hypothetical protein